MKLSKYFCRALLLTSFCSNCVFSSNFDTQTIEKTHTTTVYSQSLNCKNESISKACMFFKNMYVNSFEYDYIRFLTDNFDYSNESDDSFSDRTRAYQKITADYKISGMSEIVGVIVSVEQQFKGKKVKYTQAHNINLKTERIIEFSDLFEDSHLAATICSNEIYLTYSALGYKKISVIRALYEIRPVNFIIRKDGLEFIFDRANIGLSGDKASVFIPIEKLKEAKPNMVIFS